MLYNEVKGARNLLSEVIKHYRKALNMSQANLAEMIGMSQQAVAKWESGKAEPDSATLKKLASIFGITVDQLLGNTKLEDDWPPEAKVLFRDMKKLTPEQFELVKKLVKEFINEDKKE